MWLGSNLHLIHFSIYRQGQPVIDHFIFTLYKFKLIHSSGHYATYQIITAS